MRPGRHDSPAPMSRWLRGIVRRVAGLASALVLAWAVVVAFLYLQRDALLYPFDPRPAAPATPGITVATLPGAGAAPPLPVWIAAPRGDRPWIVFFMGNSGSLALHEARLAALVEQGYGLAAMAYRGGAGAPGRPSEADLKADAARLWDRFAAVTGRPVAGRDRVIWGLSLGAALAVWLAARADERAVVLEAPFTRLCDAARHRYPWAPACPLLGREAYDSLGLAGRIGSPLLVLHGSADRLVPPAMGRALAEAAAGSVYVEVPGAGHDDLGRHGALDHAFRFLDGVAR